MKNIPKPTIITLVIIILTLFIMRLDNFFILWMIIFLVSFLISWLAPQIFYPIFNNKLSKAGIRAILGIAVIVCFIAFGVSNDHIEKVEHIKQKEESESRSKLILEEVNKLIEEEKIDQAITKLDNATKEGVKTSNVAMLRNKIQNLQDDKFLHNALVNLSEDEFQLLENKKLQKEFIKHEKLNSLFIVKLQQNADQRPDLIAKADEEKRKKEEIAEQKKKEVETQARKEKIETQFSALDGSHRNLTRIIKDSMNDPKSYEHVETRYFDMDDHLVIITTFRGANAFGALMKNTVKAQVSLDGEVLEIIEQF